MKRPRKRSLVIVAIAGAAAALLALATSSAGQGDIQRTVTNTGPDPALVARGRQLFVEGCSSCHGMNAKGVDSQGPSLIGVGAQSADFYLRTGRMPLSQPGHEPQRARAAYPDDQIGALDRLCRVARGPSDP